MKKLSFVIMCLLAAFALQASAQSPTTAISNTLKVWIDDLTLTADGESVGYLHISENDVTDYTAFQMCIKVPKGLKLQKVKIGRNTYDALPTDRFTGTHSVICNMVDDGTSIKIGVTSNANDLFFPDDEAGNPLDELCAIALTADNSMINGTYSITMDDIKFIIPSSFAYIPEKTNAATLTIVGGQDGPTGIVSVNDNQVEQNQVFYDLAGRAVNTPTQGVYIKNKKKVLVK